MTDTKKESLSALIDGEASEIEVHRLVREFRSDDALTTSWSIYQQVRATVRSDQTTQLGVEHHRQLFDRISDAVQAEDDHQFDAEKSSSMGRVFAGSMALAASLVVAVFIGVQKPDSNTAAPTLASQTPPVAVQPVAHEPQTAELVELDEEKQKRLRAYLNQHDQMSRMNRNQQMVNYPPERNGN